VHGQWDLTYLKLDYCEQPIEIGDSGSLKIQDGRTGQWVAQHIDYRSSVPRSVLGRTVDVIPAAQLIAYKTLLDRDVDRQDVRDLTHPR